MERRQKYSHVKSCDFKVGQAASSPEAPQPLIMEQLTSSLAPPRSSPKSSVASSTQQVAGSVAKRCVFSVFSKARSDKYSRLSNELMTLMVCDYKICNNVGLIHLQMSSSPGIVSLSCRISNRDLHSLSCQSAFPKHDGNLFEWVGTIEGPAETVRSWFLSVNTNELSVL